jgi:succinyl-diaminopimelate desuccinylase
VTDLVALTAALIDIPSVSREEADLVAHLQTQLATRPDLEVTRVGDNLVARTTLGRRWRLVLAGHTDTVAPNDNLGARVDGDRLSGLGAADMKGGLAVMLALALGGADPAIDVTYVFYAREEIAAAQSGLLELATTRPDLLAGDAALLGEPTGSMIEAGCQGTMRVRVTLSGARAHTARPWMGRNAVHRAGPLLDEIVAAELREPVIDGCRFREALQVVAIEGGVAGNVVPDRVELIVNHRFAPDRSPEEAEAFVRAVLAPALDAGDRVEVTDVALAALPATTHPLIATLVARNALEVSAKLGWTDVARFAQLGVPAANFGPGDPSLAHTRGEYVTRVELERAHDALADLISRGPDHD